MGFTGMVGNFKEKVMKIERQAYRQDISGWDYLEEDDLIKKLEELMRIAKGASKIGFACNMSVEVEDDYNDQFVWVTVMYYRWETDEEKQLREHIEKSIIEAEERKLLAELKVKYDEK